MNRLRSARNINLNSEIERAIAETRTAQHSAERAIAAAEGRGLLAWQTSLPIVLDAMKAKAGAWRRLAAMAVVVAIDHGADVDADLMQRFHDTL